MTLLVSSGLEKCDSLKHGTVFLSPTCDPWYFHPFESTRPKCVRVIPAWTNYSKSGELTIDDTIRLQERLYHYFCPPRVRHHLED